MAITSAAAAACPSCIFGISARALLTFPYNTVTTIDVSVIPHVTVYPNGSQITSYESITESQTAFVGSGSGTSATHVFTNPADLTWTVGDATLTYPTTYIQYLGFEGQLLTSESGSKCPQPSPTLVSLPSTTDVASFIYPLNSIDLDSVPTPLLDYLADLPEVSAQFDGVPLTVCSPVGWEPSSAPPSFSPPSSRLPYRNSTIPVSSAAPIPVSSAAPIPPSSTHNGPPSTHASQSLKETTTITGQESTIRTTNSVLSPSTAPAQTHITATVLNPITGTSTIYTTISARHDRTSTKKLTAISTNGHSQQTGNTKTGGHATQTSPNPNPGHTRHTTRTGKNGNTPTPSVFTHGTSKVTANSNGGVVIGTHTISRGETTTFGSGSSKTTVAVPPKGSKVIINSNTFNGVTPGPKSPTPVVSSGVVVTNGRSITIVRSKGSIVLQDGSSKTTIAPGSVATFEGQTISAPKHKGSVVVNGHPASLTAASQAVFTTHGHTFTAVDLGSSVIVADGSSTITIKDGQQTTFDGQTFSAGKSGSALIVNHKTVTISAGHSVTSEAIISAGGHTVTAIEKDGSMILADASSTITLKDGRTTTFEGQTFSAAKSGTAIVVDGTTYAMTAATTGINHYITKGLGGPSAAQTAINNSAAAAAGLPAVTHLLIFSIISFLCLIAML